MYLLYYTLFCYLQLAHYLGLKYLFLFVLRFGSVRDPDKH